MPWIVKKHGKQIGKDYNTQVQAVEGAVERKLMHFFEGVAYYQEGVEIQYLQIEEEKQEASIYAFDFRVRERLKRDRIYTIYANNEEEARDLLDGFKQQPEEAECSDENIVVDDYLITDVAKSNNPITLTLFEEGSIEYRAAKILKDTCKIDIRFGKFYMSLDELKVDYLDLLEFIYKLEEEFDITLDPDNGEESNYEYCINKTFSFSNVIQELKKRLKITRPEKI